MRALAAALSAGVLCAAVHAQAPAPAPVETTHGTRAEPPAPTGVAQPQTGADVEFLRAALSGALSEVQRGGLAQQRAATARVRELGATLARDHAASAAEIRAILSTMNVTGPDAGEPQPDKAEPELATASGPAFDRAFLLATVAAHERALERFKAHSQVNPDTELARWAARALPMLADHLAVAQRLLKDAAG
jgi:putative membrane protein